MSNQLISGEYFYKGRINYFLVKCHIYQGNKQIYNKCKYVYSHPSKYCIQKQCRGQSVETFSNFVSLTSLFE